MDQKGFLLGLLGFFIFYFFVIRTVGNNCQLSTSTKSGADDSCWISNLSLITAVLQVSGNGVVNILDLV